VLVLHGFGDTPQSVAPVCAALAAAGWTVEAPLLPGHGRTLVAMAQHDERDWLAAARAAYGGLRATHARVTLVGQSMGGALAVCLAAEHPPPAMVLLAPYLAMPPRVRRLARVLAPLAAVVPYWRSAPNTRSIHDPVARGAARALPSTSGRALGALARLVTQARAALLAVQAPVRYLQSREDHRIPAAAAAGAFAALAAPTKELVWLEGCGHVLAVDHHRAAVATATVEWLARHGGPPRAA
jgi:carboxylesterase